MTAQQEMTSTSVAKPTTYSWPWDMTEFVNSFFGDLAWPRRVLGHTDGVMRIEEAVDGDTLIVRAEVPGVDPDKDVEVSVDDGVLTITAKRESETKRAEDGAYRSEFRYGTFIRQVRMPDAADLDALTASYRDGLIEIKVPLRVEQMPRSRKVSIARS